MRQSNLLAINTVAVYARMVLTIPMGILLVRFAYGELGEIDFGLWTAIGASTAIMAVVTTSLTKSGQRHLAFAIGTGEPDGVERMFRAVLAVFWLIGIGIFVVGALCAPAILAGLSVPEDRMTAAWWVIHFSLAMVAFLTCTTPYRAILSAHQSIAVVATSEFLRTLLSLINAWCLRYMVGDKLIIYAGIEAVIVLVTGLYLVGVSLHRLPSSRCLPTRISWSELTDVGGFAFWSFFGNMAATLRSQGAILLVNVVFGPAANAAVALAVRAHGYLYRAATSLNVSLSPALTTHAGRQNEGAVARLMNLGCKLPFLAGSLIFTPFVLETDYLLDLWQDRPVPPDTAVHTRWLCGMALVGVGTWGHNMVLEARNRIGLLTSVLLASIVVTVVVCYVGCQYAGWPAWTVSMLMCLSSSLLSVFVRPWIAARELELPLWRLLGTSIVPSVLAFMPAFSLAAVAHFSMPEGPLRLLVVTLLFAMAIVPSNWFLGFDSSERDAFADIFQRAYAKVFAR